MKKVKFLDEITIVAFSRKSLFIDLRLTHVTRSTLIYIIMKLRIHGDLSSLPLYELKAWDVDIS